MLMKTIEFMVVWFRRKYLRNKNYRILARKKKLDIKIYNVQFPVPFKLDIKN